MLATTQLDAGDKSWLLEGYTPLASRDWLVPPPFRLCHTLLTTQLRPGFPPQARQAPQALLFQSLEDSLPLAVERKEMRRSKATVLSSSEHISTFLLVPQFPCLLMGVGVGAFLLFPVCIYQRCNNTGTQKSFGSYEELSKASLVFPKPRWLRQEVRGVCVTQVSDD